MFHVSGPEKNRKPPVVEVEYWLKMGSAKKSIGDYSSASSFMLAVPKCF